jgi:hypothetical protein
MTTMTAKLQTQTVSIRNHGSKEPATDDLMKPLVDAPKANMNRS